jgi:hypothetical protein
MKELQGTPTFAVEAANRFATFCRFEQISFNCMTCFGWKKVALML